MNILFFASLREQLDSEGEQWSSLEGTETAGDIKQQFQSRGEPWQSALASERLIISLNQEVVDTNAKVKLGDELAFFPPVTGG